MAPKDEELRPVMTRIPERLRRRLNREAKFRSRSMNMEIVSRLQESFDTPDQADAIAEAAASAVGSEISGELYGVFERLDEIQTQIRTVLSHLGLSDPAEEAKARAAERKASPEARMAKDAALKAALDAIERTFGPGSIARLSKNERPSDTSETKDEDKE
jgi:hypothetical protein